MNIIIFFREPILLSTPITMALFDAKLLFYYLKENIQDWYNIHINK